MFRAFLSALLALLRRDFSTSEAAKDREHNRLLLQGALNQVIELATVNNSAIIALAQAQSAQADAFATWLKGFAVPSGDSVSSTITQHTLPEDEWVTADGISLSNLPPEFHIAAHMAKLDAEYDHEGRDDSL